jgi:anti-anti-sigma factor
MNPTSRVAGVPTNVLVLEIRGDFDLVVADRLRQPLLEAIPGASPVIAFDLCECTHVDSVALGLIWDAHELAARHSGATALICPDSPHPAVSPLRISGLDGRIQTFPSRDVFDRFIRNLEGAPAVEELWRCSSGGDLGAGVRVEREIASSASAR